MCLSLVVRFRKVGLDRGIFALEPWRSVLGCPQRDEMIVSPRRVQDLLPDMERSWPDLLEPRSARFW